MWWSIHKSWQRSWNVCRMDKYLSCQGVLIAMWWSVQTTFPIVVRRRCYMPKCSNANYGCAAAVDVSYNLPSSDMLSKCIKSLCMDTKWMYLDIMYFETKRNEIRASRGRERRHKKWSALIKLNFAHIVVVNAYRSEKVYRLSTTLRYFTCKRWGRWGWSDNESSAECVPTMSQVTKSTIIKPKYTLQLCVWVRVYVYV